MARKLLTPLLLFQRCCFTDWVGTVSALPTSEASSHASLIDASGTLGQQLHNDARSTNATLASMSLLARVDPENKHKVEDYFHVEFTRDAPGSCHPWETKVREAWEETIQMLRIATGKAKMLRSSKPAPAMAERRDEWIRAEQTFRALFGKPDAKPEDFEGAEFNDKPMAEVIEGHILFEHLQLPQKPYLRCDQDYFLYVKPDHVDPRDAGTPEEGKHTFVKPSKNNVPCPNGAWILQGFPKQQTFWQCYPDPVPRVEDRAMDDVCTDDPIMGKALAKSIWFEYTPSTNRWNWDSDRRIVTLCPALLNRADPSASATSSGIKEGDRLGYPIAVTWVHEMFHYVSGWFDERAVTAEGEPWEERHTYGWREAVNLGQHAAQRTIFSPENMDLFAAAMYFKEWHWGSGRAKKCPEEEDFDPIKAYQAYETQPDNDSSSSGSESGSDNSEHSSNDLPLSDPHTPARRNAVLQHKTRDQELQDDGHSDSANGAGRCANTKTYGQVVKTPPTTVLDFFNSVLLSNTWSVKEESTNIKECQDFRFNKFLQSTWIHEMLHYIEKFIDEPSVDDKSRPRGVTYYDNGLRGTVGWPSCVNLAQDGPKRALESSENLAAFAMAVSLWQWHWPSGVAKKTPEKEPFDPTQAYKTNMHDPSFTDKLTTLGNGTDASSHSSGNGSTSGSVFNGVGRWTRQENGTVHISNTTSQMQSISPGKD
ncbi:hypothetical protein CBER1_11561 [Cercospora berteroae]|uniref:Lysine-specific metallo-endopeptidase domain-containing protein n=1 Tax=Cercospora berteroae TaxID=357750 RepID=A0A2S6C028_9PEZI|nr:hypothetical protein CBER1_11561 [Cercospora berteroae]